MSERKKFKIKILKDCCGILKPLLMKGKIIIYNLSHELQWRISEMSVIGDTPLIPHLSPHLS
jgi:hypothetical protein